MNGKLGAVSTALSILLAAAGTFGMAYSFNTQPPPGVPARDIDSLAWMLPTILIGPAGMLFGVLGLNTGKLRRSSLFGITANGFIFVAPAIPILVEATIHHLGLSGS